MGSVLIVAEIQAGQIREASYELASVAQQVASASGRDVKSLVLGKDIGSLAEAFAKRGGGSVYAADHELLADYTVVIHDQNTNAHCLVPFQGNSDIIG